MARRKSNQISFDLDKDGNLENIIEKPIEKILPESMIPYSESVILDRALPRVEDGLKPVQRRILYSMYELGMFPDKEYKKSARIVGDCLGKYHPHGDSSVYEAIVRMAQDFSMRNCLVDGQGNFGSIDGDSPAAMRYTEVRMTPLATELLRELDLGTVEWQKNFDDTLDEPIILPGRFPNLLVNGASGIAIGIATNIPTHNLSEVIDAVVAMIDNPKITLKELLTIVKGPDFPTGGYVITGDQLEQVYETGKGTFIMRAKADIENGDNDKQNIVITEIPYQVNKSALQQKIFELKESTKDKLGGITEIADESDSSGIRIVIKLKKGEDPVKILDLLYKKTDLQKNFFVNMVVIAGGKPQQLGLIDILKYYIKHQKNVVLKRTQHLLTDARKRENILKGFVTVFPYIRELVDIVLDSSSRTESKTRIKERFDLNDAQADAILDTKISSLNRLDVNKFYKELEELEKNIAGMEKIVGSQREQLLVVKKEILEVKNKYKSKRRTTVVSSIDEVAIKTFDPTVRTAKRGFVAVTGEGLVKFMTTSAYYKDDRSAESATIDNLTKCLALAEPTSKVIVFGDKGNAYRLDTNTAPESRWTDKGFRLSELFTDADPQEKAVSVICQNEGDPDLVCYAYTKNGMVKASKFSEYIVNKDTYQYMVMKDDSDRVLSIEKDQGLSTVVFVSSSGQILNALKDEIPVQGRKSSGVIGMKLDDGETVIYAGQCIAEYETESDIVTVGELLVVTSSGTARKSIMSNYRPMQRGRKGVKALDMQRGDKAVFATTILEDFDIALISTDNQIDVVNTENIRLNDRSMKANSIVFGKKLTKGIAHKEDVNG